MRAILAIVVIGFSACGKGENAGVEEAKLAAEKEMKEKAGKVEPAKKMSPPVPGQAKIPCEQLIDLAAFQTATGEKEPLVVKDVTKGDPDVTSSCSLIRGGKKLSAAEQAAKSKTEGRLGVLPGDELCSVKAYCSTFEDVDRLKAKCKEQKFNNDDTMGSYACVQIVAVGADDVKVYKFFDEDTKCILRVAGGPSNVNNDLIASCAKAARDTIGPAQIKVGGAPAPTGSGSGSGS